VLTQVTRARTRAVAGAALAVAGLLVSPPITAHAAALPHLDAATSVLPKVGSYITVPLGDELEFVIGGKKCDAKVAGSVGEDVTAQDPTHLTDTVQEQGFFEKGSYACASGSNQTRAGGGTITIEQNDIDVDAKSLLRLTQQFPPKFEQVMVLSFTMTIDQPDASNIQARAADQPLVLETKNPAKLVGQLTQFPPRGDLYQLQNPVDLVLPDEPDITIATIQKFPVKVGGL
jgi:hypothetical protein